MRDDADTNGAGDSAPSLGKVDRAFFAERIAPKLGADREDVRLGPAHGVDFGIVDVGGRALVTATDPLSILPALGWERAGEFALHIALADVAVSGLAPTHLAVSFTLPPTMTDEQFAAVWNAIDAEARDLGAAVVTGHTARYGDCSFPWVGAATAMAVGDHDDIVRPDGARPGDRLLVTNGPAVETTGLLATLFPNALELSPSTLSAAQDRLDEASCVRDALAVAAAVDPTAMHDATEGGLRGALCELADSAGVRIDVESTAVPLRPGVASLCEAVEIDPWDCTSSGTLLIAVDPSQVDEAVAALEARGTSVGVAGRVSGGDGVYIDGERVRPPSADPSWEAYERLAKERE